MFFLINPDDVPEEKGQAYHGGSGSFNRRTYFQNIDGSSINYLRDIVVPIGTVIGVHSHTDEEEVFFFISGTGTVTMNDKIQKVGPGSVLVTLPGGFHGVENDGETDLRFITVCVKNKKDH